MPHLDPKCHDATHMFLYLTLRSIADIMADILYVISMIVF